MGIFVVNELRARQPPLSFQPISVRIERLDLCR